MMMSEKIRIAKEIKKKKLRDFDTKYKVDFEKSISRVALGNTDNHCFGYQPSFIMPNILAYLKIGEKDSLLDVGCGKGFAMHLFSNLPFDRIDGIETNGMLAKIAQENLKKLHPNDSRFHIFEIDARDFLNYEDYDILYLFNPFDAKIVEEICKKFGNKRPSKIIYQMPHYVDIFIRHGFTLEYEADATIILRR